MPSILDKIFRVTYYTLREVRKNAFNPGQNIVDIFLNIKETGFSVKYFRSRFLQFCFRSGFMLLSKIWF